MTQFQNKRFSVSMGGGDYGDNWERTFGKREPEAKPLWCVDCRTVAGTERTSRGCSCGNPSGLVYELDPLITVTVDGGSKVARTVEVPQFKTRDELFEWIRDEIDRRAS